MSVFILMTSGLEARTSVYPLYDMHVERGGQGVERGGEGGSKPYDSPYQLFEKGGEGANRQI
jgi:hypothetical protein